MNIVNDILVNTLFPDTDFVQTLSMNSVVPKYVENQEKGNPSVCKNCAEAPFKDLHIYGRSEQMTTTGAQLLTSSVTKGHNAGVTLTKKDSVWHLEGTNTADGTRNIRIIEPTEHFKLSAGTYTLSFSKDGVFPIGINVSIAKVANPDVGSEQIWTGIGNAGLNKPTKFTLDGTEEALSVFVNFPAGEFISCDLYIMLNAGDTALPWEPYTGGKPSPSPDYPQEIQSAGDDGNLSVIVKNPDNEQMQSVSFSTPNGLPGIPVSANGNYTDSNGQQWACDELDFERGVYRQWIKHVNVVFHKTASPSTHSGYRHIAVDIKNLSNHKECLCNIATYSKDAANGTEGVRASGGYNAIILYYENLTNDNVPADVAYILSDPIETPITAAEIATYKSLRTYKGTTIVEAEDKAGISVKYNMPMPELSKNGALRRWFKRHPII